MERTTTPYAVGYVRVSTEDQKEKAISPEVQANDCREAIERDGYALLEVIYDLGKSGGSLKRPGIQKIIELATERQIKAIYTISSDRLSRNTKEYLYLRDLLIDHGVELHYVRQANPDNSALGRTMDEVSASFNQLFRLQTSEKVKNTLYSKVRAGYWPEYAPPGYKNAQNPDKTASRMAQRIIVPDPESFHVISEGFRLFATGLYTGCQLADVLYDNGLRSRNGGKLSLNATYRILRNPFYIGEIHWGPIHVKEGQHTPLIDRDTFQRVQNILDSHNHHACRRRKFTWLLNGFLFCHRHQVRYTAEWHLNKGRAYYHCTNRTGCGKYSEMVKLENEIGELFRSLEFDPKFIELVLTHVQTELRAQSRVTTAEKQRLINQKTAWEAKKKVAQIKLIDGVLSDEDYRKIIGEIENESYQLNARIERHNTGIDTEANILKSMLAMTQNIYSTYEAATPEIKKQYLGLFWDKFEIEDAVIINTHLSPLFAELVAQHRAFLKTKNLQITGDSSGPNQVIIRNFWLPLVDKFRTANWYGIQQELQFSGILGLFSAVELQN